MLNNISQLIESAFIHFQSEELEQAKKILLSIQTSIPKEPHSLHLLGLIYFKQQDYTQSIKLLNEALPQIPNSPQIYNSIGICLLALQKLEKAQLCFEQAITLLPTFIDARENLANTYLQLGDEQSAITHLNTIIQQNKNYEPAHYSLGSIYQKQQHIEQSNQHYSIAIALNKQRCESFHNLGLNYYHQGLLQEAYQYYLQAYHLQPENPIILNSIGLILLEQENYQESLQFFKQALSYWPEFPEAHLNSGNAYRHLSLFEKSLKCYEQALKYSPDNADIMFNIGTTYQYSGHFDKALTAFKQVLELTPTPVAHLRYATLLPIIYKDKGQPEIVRQRMARELDILETMSLSIQDPFLEKCMTSGHLIYQCQNDKTIQKQLANIYLSSCSNLNFVAPFTLSTPKEKSGKKIKIAFISSHFYRHTISKLMAGLITHLNSDIFEVYTLYTGEKIDLQTQILSQETEHFHHLSRDLEKARQTIARFELDILFYCDIGMDTFTYFLAFSRLATLQCVTWGHPVTTGIPTMDYFFSSLKLETDENPQQHYSEKLIVMKQLIPFFYCPELKESSHRADFNLPDDKTLYYCPQTLYKFHPIFDDMLKDILLQDKEGRLILLEGKAGLHASLLKQRLHKTMPEVIDQIIFLPSQPQDKFFQLLELCDVILDSYPYGGGNSSYEAFAFGKPIITLPTQLLSGRITYSIYQQMEIEDCIASDQEDYINLALKLGRSPGLRQSISQKILAAHSKIFENQLAIKEFEEILLSLTQSI